MQFLWDWLFDFLPWKVQAGCLVVVVGGIAFVLFADRFGWI